MHEADYADLECLIDKIDGCGNNLEYSSIARLGKHIHCRYSISSFWGFYHMKNKHSFCLPSLIKKIKKQQ